ncbi:hypothetical protein PENSPDRAFT_651425 [Peniophora sp. CONT]|nr:hypothetical protein PENSPDRAFT_651425 [Peniophora sp. CONT]
MFKSSFANFIGAEFGDFAVAQSNEELEVSARANSDTVDHAVGTVPMGRARCMNAGSGALKFQPRSDSQGHDWSAYRGYLCLLMIAYSLSSSRVIRRLLCIFSLSALWTSSSPRSTDRHYYQLSCTL